LTLSKVKFYKKLLNNKTFRLSQSLGIAEGPNAVESLLRFCPEALQSLYYSSEYYSSKIKQILINSKKFFDEKPESFYEVPNSLLERITSNSAGVLAEFSIKAVVNRTVNQRNTISKNTISKNAGSKNIGLKNKNSKNADSKTVLLLDNISDPGNLGTIIRAAAAFWVDEIYLTNNSVDQFNSKVIRASAGSIFAMPIYRLEYKNAINHFQKEGFSILATAFGQKAQPIAKADLLHQKSAFVFGNESSGLTSEKLEKVKKIVYIPISDNVESLNLAGAVYSLLALKSAISNQL
jgi:tRNA G18 (ribose-2'-O)-methylase SpoU